MTSFSDRAVFAVRTNATGTLVSRKCVLRGLHFNDTSGGAAGSVIFKDGGSGGATKLQIDTPGKGESDDVPIPGGGIVFGTDLHVTLTNVDAMTAFYTEEA